MLRALTDLVFAPVCLACEHAIPAGDSARLVCRRCRSLLPMPPPPLCARCGAPRLATGRIHAFSCPECESWPATLRTARAACLYYSPADRLVHALKYGGWKSLADIMAQRMAGILLPDETREEARVCVSVPTTAARRRQRGYDQAELLAHAFAARTGRSLRNALVRTSSAGSQTALQPLARGANVAGGFRADARVCAALAGAHILLIDDVLTTGATANECARTLVLAGIRCVSLVTFARALDTRRLLEPVME
jgi:ComF family protein